jgi:hypothetical protein
MGILFISITAGVAVVAILLIMFWRKNKTIENPGGPGSQSILEKKTGSEEGIYD